MFTVCLSIELARGYWLDELSKFMVDIAEADGNE